MKDDSRGLPRDEKRVTVIGLVLVADRVAMARVPQRRRAVAERSDFDRPAVLARLAGSLHEVGDSVGGGHVDRRRGIGTRRLIRDVEVRGVVGLRRRAFLKSADEAFVQGARAVIQPVQTAADLGENEGAALGWRLALA